LKFLFLVPIPVSICMKAIAPTVTGWALLADEIQIGVPTDNA